MPKLEELESPTAGKPKPIARMVSIKALTEDPSLQIRGGTDPKKVKEYERIIREQETMDSIDVFYLDPITAQSTLYVADGFHRLCAYRNVGVEEIPCRLRVGSHADALKFTLKKNGHHGAQLTNAEKRSAVEKAVLDKEVAEMSDKDIARLIGCSSTLVGQARRGETKSETSKKRTARAGKRETESSAPREAMARERKPKDAQPTKAMILKSIEGFVERDQVDESEIVALFETKTGQYRFLPKEGGKCEVRVTGRSGREQATFPVTVRALDFERLNVRYEGKEKVSAR